jgi:ubiquinone/menaquinone biosynthesis C-methylase UbiE
MRDACDDETLARQYVEGRRSRVDYLERPAFESLLPPIANKRVLELGAGSGDWAARMADGGAASVTALEKSAAMRRCTP